MWLGVAPRTDTRASHVFKRDWVMCSKYEHESHVDSQHNWGDLV